MAMKLCKMVLTNPEALHWLRENGDQNILHTLSGIELLSHIWLGGYDPSIPDAFNSFTITLARDEEAAFNQIQNMAPVPSELPDVKHAVHILSITYLQQQKQRLQTQLKQPNLDPQDVEELTREIMELHKELTEAQRLVSNATKG